MQRPRLTGNTIDLEPLTRAHISKEYISWFNDPIVCRYNRHGSGMTPQKVEEYIDRVKDSDTDAVFAVITSGTGVHVGNISLQKIDRQNQSAEYAVIVGNRDYWGKGVAKEASLLLLRYGFETLGLHRIYCGTSAANVPMQRLASRLGFMQEGVRKEAMYKNGTFFDVIGYGLLKKDFSL